MSINIRRKCMRQITFFRAIFFDFKMSLWKSKCLSGHCIHILFCCTPYFTQPQLSKKKLKMANARCMQTLRH